MCKSSKYEMLISKRCLMVIKSRESFKLKTVKDWFVLSTGIILKTKPVIKYVKRNAAVPKSVIAVWLYLLVFSISEINMGTFKNT